MTRIGKSIANEGRLVVMRGWEKGEGRVTAKGYWVSFWVIKMFGMRQRWC